MFLTGFGYVYVDIAHQCGTIIVTLAPEGRPGQQISLNRYAKTALEGHKREFSRVQSFRCEVTY